MKKTGVVELKENVYWVGAIDWNIRDFHGYITDRGTTYNAYLIVDEKIVLVDTVKHGFYNEMSERIREIVELEKIDYVISNHVEMDHSGCLPDIMKDTNAKLIATDKGADGLKAHYQTDWDIRTVKTGDTLSLGKKNLVFVATPMLHWPDSMATYIKEDHLLLSNDAFGQHLASYERFEDQLGDIVMAEAATYYANILMPLAPLILKKLDEIISMEIEIDMIAPSHGVIWRRDPSKIIEAYANWSTGIPKKKILIIYDTMWGSTETMAKAIGQGIVKEAGVEVRLLHLRKNGWTEIIREVLDSKALIIGSPTLNNGVFPTVAGFLAYLKGLKPKNKTYAVFGSYGWGGGAVLAVNDELKKAGFEVGEGIEIRFRPDKKGIDKCVEFGANIARKVKE